MDLMGDVYVDGYRDSRIDISGETDCFEVESWGERDIWIEIENSTCRERWVDDGINAYG